jgi:deoxyuridine 5'-triphosphate nucleotidohydrolase
MPAKVNKIGFKKLSDKGIIPTRKFESDAGWDIYSAENLTIPAKAQAIIHTDVQLATCPPSIALQAWSRSGLDSKYGLHVGAGIIDPGFRGELLVCLKNMNSVEYTVKEGDKIAQFIPIQLPKVSVVEVQDIEDTDRGSAGGIMETANLLS